MQKEPIRVLHVVNRMNMGGVQSVVMNYYRHMDQNIVQFDFVVQDNKPGFFDNEIRDSGGKIYTVRPLKKLFYFYIDLARILKQNDYSIIHIHQNFASVHALIIAFLFSVQNRIIHSHSAYHEKSFIKNVIKKEITGIINLLSTHRYACSEIAAEWLYGKKAVEENKISIINNAISVESFKYNADVRQAKREEFGIIGDFTIGHIGQLSKLKNQSFLIDIFNEICKLKSNTHLMLIGQGISEPEIKNKVHNLKLDKKVTFLGARSDVNELLSAYDVFVFPSLFEGLPVVLIEAQTAGLRCFISDKVTREVALTDLAKYISLDKSAKEWAQIILAEAGFSEVRNDMTKIISESGYNIEMEARKLQGQYIKMAYKYK